jgi:hypothetical protein
VQGPLGSHYMVPVSESYMPSSTKENFIFFLLKYSIKSRDSSVVIELGNGLDDRGSRVRLPVGAGIFLFTTASRTALGPTQPTIQWVPGALTLGVKRPGSEADHSPSSSAGVNE